ncbi:hypothetical protein DDI_3372 [Dickeya dianthicola RNS04.9]|nr:hypothetical protein DDI_3372 [Dickeya dianthicola RNS04.9]
MIYLYFQGLLLSEAIAPVVAVTRGRMDGRFSAFAFGMPKK